MIVKVARRAITVDFVSCAWRDSGRISCVLLARNEMLTCLCLPLTAPFVLVLASTVPQTERARSLFVYNWSNKSME